VTSRYPRLMVSKRWTWLAGLAVLFAGLTNAHSHVHYCFDGQEPPAAVHLVDSTDHEHEMPGQHGADDEHDDLDLDVPNQALSKAVKHDLPANIAVAWATAIEALPGSALAESFDVPAAPNPRYALPQLRAPPR
jgi:hypothetical protein